MKITTVLFDPDSTLLPMDQDAFLKHYFGGLAANFPTYGYDPKALVNAIWAGTAVWYATTAPKVTSWLLGFASVPFLVKKALLTLLILRPILKVKLFAKLAKLLRKI